MIQQSRLDLSITGIALSSPVSVGQVGFGTQYALTSLIALVLDSASIFGGRGSYIGAVPGAQIVTGLLILGTALFSRARYRNSGGAS